MATAVQQEKQAQRHYGKFRGTVTDTEDPKKLGRLRAVVPELLGDVPTNWAWPCAPTPGHFAIPKVGTGVWIEFMAGKLSRPIWTGCWWGSGDVPTDESGTDATPDLKIFRSDSGLMLALHDDDNSIAVSDSDGQNLLNIKIDEGTITLKATSKVVVDAPQIELVKGASHALVLGDQLMSYLSQLVIAFNTHMHPGEVAGVIPVTPMLPAPLLQPPTPDLLSLQVKTG